MTNRELKYCLRYLDELQKSGLNIQGIRYSKKRLYYIINNIEEYISISELCECLRLIDEQKQERE